MNNSTFNGLQLDPHIIRGATHSATPEPPKFGFLAGIVVYEQTLLRFCFMNYSIWIGRFEYITIKLTKCISRSNQIDYGVIIFAEI